VGGQLAIGLGDLVAQRDHGVFFDFHGAIVPRGASRPAAGCADSEQPTPVRRGRKSFAEGAKGFKKKANKGIRNSRRRSAGACPFFSLVFFRVFCETFAPSAYGCPLSEFQIESGMS
jgi:hypothetical protein